MGERGGQVKVKGVMTPLSSPSEVIGLRDSRWTGLLSRLVSYSCSYSSSSSSCCSSNNNNNNKNKNKNNIDN